MAIPVPDKSQIPEGPRRDFLVALHKIYDEAGQPAARAISRDIFNLPRDYENVSHETVSATLRGGTVPGWTKIKSILKSLAVRSPYDYDESDIVRRFNPLWVEASREAATKTNSRPHVPSPLAEPAETPRESPAPPSTATPPAHSQPFIGRENLLERIRAALLDSPETPLVLHGVIGAGKSRIAREFATRDAGRYDLIWWVPADSAARVTASLVDLGKRLGVAGGHGTDVTVQHVMDALERSPGHHLIVYDDVRGDVRPPMPASGVHTVMTSRDPGLAHDSSRVSLEVPDLDEVEARQFLRTWEPDLCDRTADRVVSAFGRTPWALHQVLTARQVTGASWDELLATPRAPSTVSDTLKAALARMAAENPVLAEVAALFAYFGSRPVPVAMLHSVPLSDSPRRLYPALRNPVQVRRLLADLRRFGLARLDGNGERVEVPAILRLGLREALTPAALEEAQHDVHQILTAADPGLPDDQVSLDMHVEISAHVFAADLVSSRLVAAHRAVYHQLRYRYLVGEYEEARELGAAAVETWRGERFLGPDHQMVVNATAQWANALRALGEHQQARELTSEALSRLRADPDHGVDHTLTLALADSHAADLRIVGEYRRALEVATETHRRCATRFGEADTRTTKSRHNLAVSLRLMGDFRNAEAADRELLALHREARGEENWRTLLSLNALAEDLYGLGRYAEVLDLLPQDNRDQQPLQRGMLLAGRTVALARRSLGHTADALEMLRAHHQYCVASFGAEHEYTLVARTSLANTLRERGDIDGAFALSESACAVYQTTFGPRNPLTLAARVNHANILRVRGDQEGAEKADAVASEALYDTLGEFHPFTVAAFTGLATDHAQAGRHAIARALSERAYSTARAVHGPVHPAAMAAAANLVLDLVATGEVGAAANLRDEVSAGLVDAFGPNHSMVDGVRRAVRITCSIEPPSA